MSSARRLFLAATQLTAGRGGIGRVARLMAAALADIGRQAELPLRGLTLLDPDSPSDLSLPVRTARGSRPRFVWEAWKGALWGTHVFYDYLGLARAHGRGLVQRRPFLAFMHGIEIWEDASRPLVAAARRADVILSNSRYTRERADRLHRGLDRAEVCWLGTESDRAPPCRSPTGPPRVLMVSRVEDFRKGHEAMLAAWPEVAAAVPGAVLSFAGSGACLGELGRRAALTPAGDRIEVKGFVPEAELEDLYAEATVFAMPSRKEGFGLVYVEAMRHALPVIATVHDAGGEINVDGETGYNVDLDRPSQLPGRLIELLRDRDRAAALGDRAQQRWRRHFRFSAFRRRFAEQVRVFLEI